MSKLRRWLIELLGGTEEICKCHCQPAKKEEGRQLIKRRTWSWTEHVDAKFKSYERLWDEAYKDWQKAKAIGDADAVVEAFERQGLYLRAEQLARSDMQCPEDQQQWDRNYEEEARSYLSLSSNPTDRINAVERIMAMTPRY